MHKKISLCLAAATATLCCAGYVNLAAQTQTSTSSSAQSGTSAATSSTTNVTPGVREYLLGPGDQLDLRVQNESQYDGTLDINSTGQIIVPFMDDKPIQAQCRTVDDVRRDIVMGLSKLLRKPQVSLRVTERRSRSNAVVSGAVLQPGQIQMNRPARLLELLNFSGGVTDRASGTVTIFHTEKVLCPDPVEAALSEEVAGTSSDEDNLQVPFAVYNLNDIKAGKAEANPLIRPGDIVRVEEASPVYITGLVQQPQGVFLRDKLTLTRAIAQVGGLRKEAKNSIKIYRMKPDSTTEFETIAVNYSDIRKQKTPDVLLMPYDVIEVGEVGAFNPKRFTETLLGIATGGVGQIITGGATKILY